MNLKFFHLSFSRVFSGFRTHFEKAINCKQNNSTKYTSLLLKVRTGILKEKQGTSYK